MATTTLAWVLFGAYLLFTTGLALRGVKKTRSFSGFALGNGDLGPLVVGITLAAAIASTATFVINPGFVYAAGVAALLHHGVAAYGGVMIGLVIFSAGFRKLGMAEGALTLPHWIYVRYRSRALRTYFATFNLLVAITFVVLIVKGSALVMQATLGLGYLASLVLIVGFVFSYIMLGGTYAHVYTNAFQGGLMVIVALVVFGSGLPLLGDGLGPFLDRLAAIDAQLVTPVNTTAPFFDTPFTVFVAGFVVGLGLVAQPHVLTKALYLRSDRDLGRYFVFGIAVCVVYALVLATGLYARLVLPEPVAQDAVVPAYIAHAFPPWVGAPVAVALLAAGMSTLDGILVSASTIAANDVFLGALARRRMAEASDEERSRLALAASRYVLVGMGVAAFLIAVDPPRLVGIFAQWGVYGLVSASLIPIGLGVLWTGMGARAAAAAAVVGPVVHFGYYGYVTVGLGQALNPAVSATFGIVASLLAALAASAFAPRAAAAQALSDEGSRA